MIRTRSLREARCLSLDDPTATKNIITDFKRFCKQTTNNNGGKKMENIFRSKELDKLVLEVGDQKVAVEKNAEGLPTAWRILPFGAIKIQKNGASLQGVFASEDATKIVKNYTLKGAKIPIDSNHMLYMVAAQLKREESEIAKLTGEDSLAMGFGALEQRDDGLWIADVEWLPLGAELMKEKVFRYFSPVIRGLKDGNLRITSMSVLNLPAINGLDAIAATGESLVPQSAQTDESARENIIVVGKIKDALKLSSEDGKEAILGAIQGVMAKISDYDVVKQRLDAIELAAEENKKAELIQQGLNEGKLTNDMVGQWASEQSSIALGAFLKAAPKDENVPLGQLKRDGLKKDGEVELTEADKAICDQMGLSSEDFLKTKKAQNNN